MQNSYKSLEYLWKACLAVHWWIIKESPRDLEEAVKIFTLTTEVLCSTHGYHTFATKSALCLEFYYMVELETENSARQCYRTSCMTKLPIALCPWCLQHTSNPRYRRRISLEAYSCGIRSPLEPIQTRLDSELFGLVRRQPHDNGRSLRVLLCSSAIPKILLLLCLFNCTRTPWRFKIIYFWAWRTI